MKLPTTRRACVKLYSYRRFHNRALTKLDMYLGGMICCSNDEFLYRSPLDDEVIGGEGPCLCKYKETNKCYYAETNKCYDCIAATEKTLRMPWDAPLYDEPPKCQNEMA